MISSFKYRIWTIEVFSLLGARDLVPPCMLCTMHSALFDLDDPPSPDHVVNGLGLSEKIFHLMERNHAGGITEGFTRSGMSLEKQTIAANRDCGSRKVGNILRASSSRIPTRDAIISNYVRGIENHRATDLLHSRNGAEV